MYSHKIIQTLKPDWYLKLSKNEKLEQQKILNERHANEWKKKPKLLSSGCFITSNETFGGITKGRRYKVKNHFCYLVTTICDSRWNQFVTVKNDMGYTVKVNLKKFNNN